MRDLQLNDDCNGQLLLAKEESKNFYTLFFKISPIILKLFSMLDNSYAQTQLTIAIEL